jgi:hypothetical protein
VGIRLGRRGRYLTAPQPKVPHALCRPEARWLSDRLFNNRRKPIAPHQFSHRRTRPRPRQQFVFFKCQHKLYSSPLERGRSVKKSKRVHDVRYVEIHPWTKNPIPATINVVSMSRMNSRSGNQSRIFFPTNEPTIMIDPRARPITILSDVRIATRR